MANRRKPTEKVRKAAVRKYSDTPSPNPRYKGATPADLGRALLGKPVRHTTGMVAEDESPVKSGV